MNEAPIDTALDRTLEDTHRRVKERHLETRGRLLDELDDHVPSAGADEAWRRLGPRLGLMAVAASLAAAVWLGGAGPAANAAERMARALMEVRSFSYRMETTFVSHAVGGRRFDEVQTGLVRRKPRAFRVAVQIWRGLAEGEQAEPKEKSVDIYEVHREDGAGVLVDRIAQTYFTTPPLDDSRTILSGAPLAVVHMVRERRCRVVGSLGERRVDGTLAEGVVIELDREAMHSDFGPTSVPREGDPDHRGARFDVWIDPATDLPLEFSRQRRGADWEETVRFVELRWNPDLPADVFSTRPPEGFAQVERPDVEE